VSARDEGHAAGGPPAAAVDLGTNSTLLVIARSVDGAPVVLEDLVRMPRLGQDVGRTGRLDPAAVQRTLAVLDEYAARMDAHGVPADRRRVVSTAVLRAAAPDDVERFGAALRERTGLALEVLDGEEEARLGWVAALGDGAAPDSLLVDVGGGSSELVWDGGRARRSVPIGAVVLSERCGGDLDAALDQAREACRAFPEGIAAPAPGAPEGAPVVALGGSGVNLAALELGLERFEPQRTEGVRVAAEAAGRWARRLASLGPLELAALPIEPERARILPAGLVVLAAVLERIGAREARVSGRGIRYGVLAELLGRGA
jgi:exopolyphosphatase/guanosine-5'-triphosphate,3'-diphosphate pyrophosphatase